MELLIKILVCLLLLLPLFWFGFGQKNHIGSFVIEWEIKPLKRFFDNGKENR